jgi:hypothetical protein
LDLPGVPMLETTGGGALVAFRAAAHRVGLRFAVVATRPIVYQILQMVGPIEALNVAMPAEPNGDLGHVTVALVALRRSGTSSG